MKKPVETMLCSVAKRDTRSARAAPSSAAPRGAARRQNSAPSASRRCCGELRAAPPPSGAAFQAHGAARSRKISIASNEVSPAPRRRTCARPRGPPRPAWQAPRTGWRARSARPPAPCRPTGRPAAYAMRAWFIRGSEVADVDDLVVANAARRLLPPQRRRCSPDQRTRDPARADRDQAPASGRPRPRRRSLDPWRRCPVFQVHGRRRPRGMASSVVGSITCAAASLVFDLGDAASMKPLFVLGRRVFSAFSDRSPWARASASPGSRHGALGDCPSGARSSS